MDNAGTQTTLDTWHRTIRQAKPKNTTQRTKTYSDERHGIGPHKKTRVNIDDLGRVTVIENAGSTFFGDNFNTSIVLYEQTHLVFGVLIYVKYWIWVGRKISIK